MNWKRWLFLFHRWVGIALCALFVAWFVSGLFMMYVEFPQLTRPERLAGLEPLDFTRATITPAQAVARLRRGDFATRGAPNANELLAVEQPDAPLAADYRIRLGMVAGRPVYIVHVIGAQPRVVFADDGQVLRTVTPELALQSALAFARRSGLTVRAPTYDALIQTDQWTVSAALNEHRPLHRIALHDAATHHYYVSSTTGQVVRDTQARERVLNYFAAVTHWLYPTFIRRHPDAWAWMVDVLAGIGTVFAVSGLWIGVVRWRRKRSPGKPAVPYRGLLRWHYFVGVVFGVTLLTWVLSGLLSMNPGQINPSRAPSANEASIFAGRAFDTAAFVAPRKVLPVDAVEADLLFYAGQPFYGVTLRDGSRRMVAGASVSVQVPTVDAVLARAPQLMLGTRLVAATVLTKYDDYYYSRHPERGDKPLPVVRVKFADDRATWFHIDALTGQILERSTRVNRIYRWLYNGLHSWDVRCLWERRPLWDIVVIVFMSGGTALSLLGVIIGIRRLRYMAGSVH